MSMNLRAYLIPSLILILLAVIAQPLAAMTLEDANRELEEAHLLFERGETRRAMDIYVRVATEGFPSPKIWTNAGTAAFRSGDTGRAVLFYSRALRLDPNYDRALQSLRFVQPESNNSDGGLEFLRSTIGRISPAWWALIAQLAFIGVCATTGLSLARWKNHEERTHWLIVTAWSSVIMIVLVVMTFWTHSYRVGGGDAVVMTNGAIARSEPRQEAVAQLEIPAGTLVRLVESPARGFVRVRLADGQSGFISTRDLEQI